MQPINVPQPDLFSTTVNQKGFQAIEIKNGIIGVTWDDSSRRNRLAQLQRRFNYTHLLPLLVLPRFDSPEAWRLGRHPFWASVGRDSQDMICRLLRLACCIYDHLLIVF